MKYTKKALTKQDCDAVVFEVPNSPGIDFYEALAEARRKCKGMIFLLHQGRKDPTGRYCKIFTLQASEQKILSMDIETAVSRKKD